MDRSRTMAGLAIACAVGAVSCGVQPGGKETATPNADNSLALIERVEPMGGPAGTTFESLYIEARGKSSGSRYQIAGFVKARDLQPQWIGRTTLTLCLSPPASFLVNEVKVQPTPAGEAGFNSGFAEALGGPATITIIQACSGDDATAVPPPATGPAATAAPAAAGG